MNKINEYIYEYEYKHIYAIFVNLYQVLYYYIKIKYHITI